MPENAVAKRYAEALYEVASAEGLEDRIGAELAELGRLWQKLPELPQFLAHPLIGVEEKERVLQKLGRDLHSYTLNLLRLLVRKRRTGLFPAIRGEFLTAAEEAGKLIHVILRTAREVTPEELSALREKLERVWQRPVALTVEQAPELLAGAELLIRGRRLDASARGRLARLVAGLRG